MTALSLEAKDYPDEWVRTRLGDLVELKYGKALPEKARIDGPFGVFGSNGPIGVHDQPLTSGPTIIIGRKGSIGEVCFSAEPCWPIDTTYYVDQFGGLEANFILKLLRTLNLTEMNRASAIPGLNRDEAHQRELMLPPAAEQRRIVARINNLSAKSKRARDRLDHVPRLVEKYKTAVIEAALGGKLTQGWRLKRETAEWRQCHAVDLFTWASGKNLTSKAMVPGPVPVIGGNGINGSHEHPLIERPTIVVGRVGAQCGNVHLTSGPAWITDNAIYARTISPKIDPAFALILFRHADLNARAGGSGQPYVNQRILDAVEISLPNVEEQRGIVRRIGAVFAWIDRLESKATSARMLIDCLDQAVLATAFRGELVPQDPNDETASVLLGRIRAERAEIGLIQRRRGRPPR